MGMTHEKVLGIAQSEASQRLCQQSVEALGVLFEQWANG